MDVATDVDVMKDFIGKVVRINLKTGGFIIGRFDEVNSKFFKITNKEGKSRVKATDLIAGIEDAREERDG